MLVHPEDNEGSPNTYCLEGENEKLNSDIYYSCQLSASIVPGTWPKAIVHDEYRPSPDPPGIVIEARQ